MIDNDKLIEYLEKRILSEQSSIAMNDLYRLNIRYNGKLDALNEVLREVKSGIFNIN